MVCHSEKNLRLRMCENRVPRMLEYEREEVMVGWRKEHYEKHECTDLE
jgi:hypothetical protein